MNGRPVAPVLSDEEDYCWVFHPSYGFYFIEGQTNNHYRFCKGDGKGTSHTEVIPNRLYDDLNRGYAFVDRKDKTVQIQTAPLVADWLDFVPKQVLNGFKEAFPGYKVFLKGCHLASLKNKVALDALLEMISDEDYATHQHHSDPDYTTQNGKDYAGANTTEIEEGALNDSIPGRLLASKKIATNYPTGYRVNADNPGKGFKWIWSKSTGPILFNYYATSGGGTCVHSAMCSVNHLDYDETEKGFIILDDDVLRVRCVGGAGELRDEAVDDTVDEFFELFPIKDDVSRIDVEASSYNGIYSRGNTMVASRIASKACVACESGDCVSHGGSIDSLTKTVVKPQPPVESVIEDAAFFKESENDFEVSRTASGKVIVADVPQQLQEDNGQQEAEGEEQEQLTKEELVKLKQSGTKSYGVGMPLGGSPTAPKPSAANPNPQAPPPNPVPPVQTVNKTPQQLHDEAQNNPAEAGNLTQQQLSQVLEALKSSALNETQRYAEQIRLAAIPIKDTPTSLPPRDDMRRHIDETAQDEVMEGVKPSAAPTEPGHADATMPPPPTQPQVPVAPTAQQELLKQTLSSDKKAWSAEDEDDDDDENVTDAGTLYGKPIGRDTKWSPGQREFEEESMSPHARLEYLRGQLRAERISYSELSELQDLVKYIEPDDVELLEAAGVPEEEVSSLPPKPKKRFRTTDKDKDLMKSMGIKAKKAGITPTGEICNYCKEEYSNGTCDYCGDLISNHCDASNSAVQCQDCGKWVGNCCCMTEDQRGNVCNTCYPRYKKQDIYASKTAMQTEEGVNLACPACHGQDVKKLQNTNQEDGSLVECLACGCFFAI
jgi:hypothetical protein